MAIATSSFHWSALLPRKSYSERQSSLTGIHGQSISFKPHAPSLVLSPKTSPAVVLASTTAGAMETEPRISAATPSKSLPFRVGHGFDLHRLEPGYPLIVGGITIPHDRGCEAHSDGDVLLHCIVDAILGALGLPDIGQIFPDNDPKWKGAASSVFIKEAVRLMHEAGYELGNLDATLILQKPKSILENKARGTYRAGKIRRTTIVPSLSPISFLPLRSTTLFGELRYVSSSLLLPPSLVNSSWAAVDRHRQPVTLFSGVSSGYRTTKFPPFMVSTVRRATECPEAATLLSGEAASTSSNWCWLDLSRRPTNGVG
nr:2-C-methyl-D-erythritol 2,4-cyclodiphosphate synthase, chloroplastic [Ipomoea batatas]